MSLEMVSIAFNHPFAIAEQIRLVHKYLAEDFHYTVVDASTDTVSASAIQKLCETRRVGYVRSISDMHDESLGFAWARILRPREARFVGFLDHDVFPVRPTRVVPALKRHGFFGLGQNYKGHIYLWPGLMFFDRRWVGDHILNFGGFDEGGDTASGLARLFEANGVTEVPPVTHEYVRLRDVGNEHVQSWGYEVIGDWNHAWNLSRWLDVPAAAERERLFFDRIGRL